MTVGGGVPQNDSGKRRSLRMTEEEALPQNDRSRRALYIPSLDFFLTIKTKTVNALCFTAFLITWIAY
jgi:hypothetical protein